jgi:predicted DNA-binding transcriptional regulator YafY
MPESYYEAGEKFSRVFQLLVRLSETQTGLTTQQIADELEVTRRTAQRYIATLRDSVGIDIEESGGRWRIGGGTRLPALQLDRYQATQLLIALRLLHQLRTEQDPALIGALAQLARALRVQLVSRYLERTLQHAEHRPVNQQRLAMERKIIDAFVESRSVEVRYVDASGHESRRVLQPYFLEPSAEGRHLYVFARDSLSKEVRSFRLDRITDARVLPETFEVPADFDIDTLISGSWGVWQSETPDDVVLMFTEEAARWVWEARWHPTARIEQLTDGRIQVRLQVASEQEMRPWVLRWGPLVEVVEPPSLRHFIADAHRRAAALYRE